MDEKEPSTTIALSTLGQICVREVPDMGYGHWRQARSKLQKLKRGRFASCMIMAACLATTVLAWSSHDVFSGIFFLILAFFPSAICFEMSKNVKELERSYDETYLQSRPDELAARERDLVTRIEAHNRNVRLLREMPSANPYAVSRAAEVERDLRAQISALAEAKPDIARLVADET